MSVSFTYRVMWVNGQCLLPLTLPQIPAVFTSSRRQATQLDLASSAGAVVASAMPVTGNQAGLGGRVKVELSGGLGVGEGIKNTRITR